MTGWQPAAPTERLELLASPPSLAPLYLRALTSRSRGASELRPTALQLSELAVDRARLQAYQQVCGYRTSDVLPPAFPHLLGFGLSMDRMTRSDFPFPLLGLVHIRNVISQRRPLTADERYDVTVWAGGLADHRAGKQIELHTEVSTAGEVVWREVSTYLRRSKQSAPAEDRGGSAADRGGSATNEPAAVSPAAEGVPALIDVPAGIGRAYAAVSGDRNPIHLSDLSAKAFGFKKAIAHGMWLAARTAAHYEGRLGAAYSFDVSFRAPLFLPGRVALTSSARSDAWDLTVTGTRSDRTHLTGSLTVG